MEEVFLLLLIFCACAGERWTVLDTAPPHVNCAHVRISRIPEHIAVTLLIPS
jgi:hypothetical protein